MDHWRERCYACDWYVSLLQEIRSSVLINVVEQSFSVASVYLLSSRHIIHDCVWDSQPTYKCFLCPISATRALSSRSMSPYLSSRVSGIETVDDGDHSSSWNRPFQYPLSFGPSFASGLSFCSGSPTSIGSDELGPCSSTSIGSTSPDSTCSILRLCWSKNRPCEAPVSTQNTKQISEFATSLATSAPRRLCWKSRYLL